MKIKDILLCSFIVFTLFSGKLVAQLVVTNTLTPQQLAQSISGPGVQILNPVVHSGTNGYGKYNATNSNLNITEGLLLTTGTIYNAVGPNNVGNKTTYFGSQSSPTTYPLLTNYTGRTIYEYCEFEFDIIPQGDTIKFDFVFASEEYEEWVGSQYNDVFGFFISGPGITGDPGAGVYHNIALIPNTSTAVTINNVNQNSNTAYYQNNNNGTTVQYDGFTKGLKAISRVTPCATYHLKLIVADASDKLWDSGVFIEKISSNNILLLSQTAGGIPNMVEGCNNGQVIFTRQNVTNNPLTINYWIGGTAINGTDYPLIGSSPNPSSPKTITIPANQASASITIDPIADAINEGYEYLTVYLGNPFCSSQITDSIRFYIQDSLYTTVTPIRDSICVGSSTAITTLDGGSSFSWSPSTGLSSSNTPNTIASPTSTTIYTLTTTASTCVMQKTSSINVSNMNLTLTGTNITCNNSNNGSISASVSNGFPPYSFLWSGPNSYSSTSQNISALSPGTYTILVTDRKGCSKTSTITLTEPSALTASVSSPTFNGGYNVSCFSGSNGSASVLVSGGVSPYSFVWSTSPAQTFATATNLPASTYTVAVTDANNCLLNKTITLTQPLALNADISSQQNVSCFNASNGSATISVSGGTSPYNYIWNTTPVQNGNTATNMAAGTYTVNISDANACTTNKAVIITQPAAALNAVISSQTNVACKGNSSGSAIASASGGTSPYTYLWSTVPAQTGSAASGLAAGSYNVQITDSKGCSTSLPVSIVEPATNVSAQIINQVNVSCFGGANGLLNVLATGGVPGYTYNWSTTPVQTGSQIQNLSIGTYSVVVRDANNCSFSLQSTITQPSSPLSSIVSSQTNVLCFGSNTGNATVNPSGGTAPYTYQWSSNPPQTTATATNLSAGSYTVVIRDSKNCTTNQTITISQPASSVTSSISSQSNVLCFGLNTGSATVTAAGGVGPYTYNWNSSPAQTTAIANNLAAGNYTVTVKDFNNCTSLSSVSISQPTAALNASINNIIHVKCKFNNTGSATVIASGGSGSYSYSWNSSPVQTNATASNLAAGSYTVTVSDNNGCPNPITRTVVITEPSNSLVSNLSSPLFNGSNISCAYGSNGSIANTTTGGTPPYTYAWMGPSGFSSSAEDLSSLSAGNYSLTVSDINNCIYSDNISLNQPAELVPNATISAATCPSFNDGSINISVLGGTPVYTYQWSGPSSFSSTNSNITNLVAGNYSLTVTDLNNCTITTVYAVTQPGTLAITYTVSVFPGGNNVSCNGGNNGEIGSVNVTGGTPAYNYSWAGPSGFTSTSPNINSLIAGDYELVVTDGNGCTVSKSVNLSQPAVIVGTLTAHNYNGNYNISCNGFSDGSINVVTSGGTPAYTYSWTGPSGFNSNSQNISLLSAGMYTLNITDVNSCTAVSTIQLSEPNTLISSLSSSSYNGGYNIKCFGESNGSIDAQITGGTPTYNYSWNGPSGYSNSLPSISNLSSGTYSLVVTDGNGCSHSNSIVLTEPLDLAVTPNSPTFLGGNNISCYGLSDGAINLNVNGGTPNYTYLWTGTNAYTSNNQNLVGLGAGSYSVSVTDANLCSSTASITITQPNALVSSVSSTNYVGNYNISCNGFSDGQIDLTVNGGVSNYTYSWIGPNGFVSSSEDINGVVAGSYSVAITDQNSCTTSSSIILTEPAAMSLSLLSNTYVGGHNISCNGLNNGSIVLTNNGGTPDYTYNWSGPSGFNYTGQNPSGLSAGTYSVIVLDANNCSISSVINLTEPAVLSGTITSTTVNGGYNIGCKGDSTGAINQTISGGTLPYSIIWNNGSTDEDLINVPAGVYSVIINDTNNCSIIQTITLTEPDVLFASAVSPTYHGGNNIKCFGDSNGEINLGIAGGTTPYTTVWSGPNGFNSTLTSISTLVAGTYSYNVVDGNNCSVNSSIVLTEPVALTISANATVFVGGFNISCNGLNNGEIFAQALGGIPSYQYLWLGPMGYSSSSVNINELVAGTYSLTVTDTNLCFTNNTIVLTEPALLTASANSLTYVGGYNVSCNGFDNGAITTIVNGGSGIYNFQWNSPGGYTSIEQNIDSLVAGTYQLLVTDQNNCSFNLSQTLTEPSLLNDSTEVSLFFGGNNISCYNSNDGEIKVLGFGGVSPYSYSWTGPASFNSTNDTIENLFAGDYFLTVTDANSCLKTDTITLMQPDSIVQLLTSINYIGGYNIKCSGDTSGVIFNSVSGGTPNYTFSWSGPSGFNSSNQELYNVGAGTYTVITTDMNSCVKISTIVLSEPATILSAALDVNAVKCNGDSSAFINTIVNGGTPGYTFWWRGPSDYTSNLQNINGLIAGLYEVIISDTNGCQLFLDTLINQPDSLRNTYLTTEVACNGVNNGAIQVTISGGVMPYQYNWSNGATTEDLINISAGTYSLIYQDANNCLDSLFVTLTEPSQALVLNKLVDEIKCFGDTTGSINTIVSGGTSPYTLNWSNGLSSDNLNNLSSGLYILTVTDNNGCVLIDSTNLAQPDSLTMGLYSPLLYNNHNITFANGNDGSIDLSVNGGTMPYNYQWSNGSVHEDLSNIIAGVYFVNVVDKNGCEVKGQITLTEPYVLALPQGFSPNNDGKNDLFVVHGIESYPVNKITIYNRWGNIVYDLESYKNEWDGNSNNGGELPTGTYFVILEINNGEIVLKGYVELRR